MTNQNSDGAALSAGKLRVWDGIKARAPAVIAKTWRHWPLVALIVALFALGSAHAIERLLQVAPCRLCFVQRWVYWAVVAVGIAATIAAWSRPSSARLRAADFVIAGVFLTGSVVAAYHAGVEWEIFPDPGCGAAQEITAAENLAILEGRMKPPASPSCQEAVVSFAGLSMAGWNVVISLAFAVLSLVAAARTPAEWENQDD